MANNGPIVLSALAAAGADSHAPCRRDPADHCCVIDGEVCPQFVAETPSRCGLDFDDLATDPRWRRLPVAQYFADNHPGMTCKDWPQNIPDVMAAGVDLCCWADS